MFKVRQPGTIIGCRYSALWPQILSTYHICHKLLGTCHYLQSKFQIPVSSSGWSQLNKEAGCGVVGRVKELVVASGNLGSSPESSLGPRFFICEIRGLNQMLSLRSLLKSPKSSASSSKAYRREKSGSCSSACAHAINSSTWNVPYVSLPSHLSRSTLTFPGIHLFRKCSL